MPKHAREVGSALAAKGFRKTENDHTFFTLWVDGKKTVIYTKISHGEKEIGDKLLGLMARQLRMTRSQLLELVKCDLTQEGYLRHLRDAGHLPAAKPNTGARTRGKPAGPAKKQPENPGSAKPIQRRKLRSDDE